MGRKLTLLHIVLLPLALLVRRCPVQVRFDPLRASLCSLMYINHSFGLARHSLCLKQRQLLQHRAGRVMYTSYTVCANNTRIDTT
jgi:hypothetical protein